MGWDLTGSGIPIARAERSSEARGKGRGQPHERPTGKLNESLWARLLFVLAVLLPFAVLFLLPGAAPAHGGFWFWVILLACFWLMLSMIGRPAEVASEPQDPRMLHENEQFAAIRDVMDVRIATEDPSGVRTFRGRLRGSAASVHDKLKQAFSIRATPMVQEDEELGASILLVPHSTVAVAAERDVRPGFLGSCSP